MDLKGGPIGRFYYPVVALATRVRLGGTGLAIDSHIVDACCSLHRHAYGNDKGNGLFDPPSFVADYHDLLSERRPNEAVS